MSEARLYKVLSCVSCRQRKIKCDKVQPGCLQCSRSGLQCVYPTRKPTRRLPKPRQNDLLERISRLESIVVKADASRLVEADSPASSLQQPTAPPGPRPQPRGTPSSIASSQDRLAPESDRTKPSTGDTVSQYLSTEFWGHLCEEVEGIKHALEQPSDDDENDDDSYGAASPESLDSAAQVMHPSGFIHGNPGYHERDNPTHPPQGMIIRLWAIFLRKVDPFIKILHRPTLSAEIQSFIDGSLPSLHPSKHALLFCIYFAAVTSLDDDECHRELGQRRDVLARKFRMNSERALAAADYLSNPTVEDIQALAIYVSVLRCYDLSRATWVLTAMVIRLAQSVNLHRDGDGRRFTPFEAEQRRRLWWYITVLDVRGAEDRGTDAILTTDSYTIIQPTSINDDDFGPDSPEPLVSRENAYDNIITLCMGRCSVFGHISHPAHNKSPDDKASLHTEEELISYVRALEDDFIHRSDLSHPNSRYASEVARIVILKIWLIVQYPFTPLPTVTPMRVSRQTMLRTALSAMELSDRMIQGLWSVNFVWWSKSYVQWHPLAVALTELCIQTERNELTDRAWALIERVFPKWRQIVADSSKGPLWRPIRKLYKKAKEARAERMFRDMRLAESRAVPLQMPLHSLSPESAISPEMTHYQMATGPQMPAAGLVSPDSFETAMNADPSMLFSYHEMPMGYGQQGMGPNMMMNFNMTPWNDFLFDTQMNDYSPEGSGHESY